MPRASIAEVLAILRISIFQLLHLDRVPAAAVVNDAVELAGKAGKRSAAGFVNALLRRVSRERAQLPLPAEPPIDVLAITLSHPRWLAARWLARHGVDGGRSVGALRQQPRAADAARRTRCGRRGTRWRTRSPRPACRPSRRDSRRRA